MLKKHEQDGRYDYVHLPTRNARDNFGYAFINFVSPLYVIDFQRRVDGHWFDAEAPQISHGPVCKLLYAHRQFRDFNSIVKIMTTFRTRANENGPYFERQEIPSLE